MQLTGKAALISGAGGGICRAIALALPMPERRSRAAISILPLLRKPPGSSRRRVYRRCHRLAMSPMRARPARSPMRHTRRSVASTSWSAVRRRMIQAVLWSRPAWPIGDASSTST